MFKRILVPLDGSETAEIVLPTMITEAKLHGATVVLLRAIAPLRQSMMSAPSIMNQVYAQVDSIVQDYLENLAEKLQQDGLEVEVLIVRGPPAQSILDTAVGQNCDLIIIGTHGETDSPRWRFGGVANKVVKAKTDLVVMVVPTKNTS
jgi:nucleotide-binding universal stress UspA family protein